MDKSPWVEGGKFQDDSGLIDLGLEADRFHWGTVCYSFQKVLPDQFKFLRAVKTVWPCWNSTLSHSLVVWLCGWTMVVSTSEMMWAADCLTRAGSSSSFSIASFLIRATRWAKRHVEIDSWRKAKTCISIILFAKYKKKQSKRPFCLTLAFSWLFLRQGSSCQLT